MSDAQARTLTWSYGGGTQSVAIALLIAAGRLPKPDITVIADTGREASRTWEYLDRYVQPMLSEHGITVERAGHNLSTVDLYGHNGDLLMPAYTARGKLPTLCSGEWKRRVILRYLRSRGVRTCRTWLGMSTNEIERMKPSPVKWQEFYYPLAYDLHMSRHDCAVLIERHGWPPISSSCWCCPHRQDHEWIELRETAPQDWQLAIGLDVDIRAHDSQHSVFLHHSRMPLSDAPLTEKIEPTGTLWECSTGQCFM